MTAIDQQTTVQTRRDFVLRENDMHQVVVWSKSYCPHCAATKRLFRSMQKRGLADAVRVHDIDTMPNGYEIQRELEKLTGQRTVPNVFVNHTHVGGNSNAQAAQRSGRLRQLLMLRRDEERTTTKSTVHGFGKEKGTVPENSQ